MIVEDLKRLKDLKWEIFRVREEVKDKGIRDELRRLLYEIVNMIEERERELVFKVLEEKGRIDERGLKIIKGGSNDDNKRSFVEVE